MRWIFTLAFFFSFFQIHAQNAERVVSGRLTSNEDGSPLPGVNITIKGTVRGAVTDADGKYSLSVPIGSVLVFSFIGMQTTEVLVTETSLKPISGARVGKKIKPQSERPTWASSILQDTVTVQAGVAVLTNQSPTYKLFTHALNPQYISAIRKSLRLPGTKTVYSVYTNTDDIKRGLHGQFSTSFGVETATRFPKLQQTYSQGRSLNQQATWQGADARENFSWGPAIKTLEYDGSAYNYDTNGRLTLAGSGNGKRAQAFDPLQFFKHGFTVGNELVLTTPAILSSTIQIDAFRKNHTGIIPGNALLTHGASIKMSDLKIGQQSKVSASAYYNSNKGTLLPRGANLAAIMGAVYLTPSTFDNTNQTKSESKNAYRLPDGSVRSAAPGLLDNPYGIANEFPDTENSERFLASGAIQLSQQKPLSFAISGVFDTQDAGIVHGVTPGWSGYLTGRRTQRYEQQRNINATFASEYTPAGSRELNFNATYDFRYETRTVSRTDGFGFASSNFEEVESADSLVDWKYSLNRATHEINLKANYDAGFGDFTIGNRNYFSNTYAARNYVNLFPFASLKFDLDGWWWNLQIKPFGSYARSIRENPLIQQNLAALSSTKKSEQYAQYFENNELTFHAGLAPEIENKLEAGLQLNHYRFDVNASFYFNKTTNLILPVWQTNQFVLQNTAAIRNAGFNLNARYNHYFSHGRTLQASFNFTHYNTVVSDVYGTNKTIPLAGFQDVYTVASKGEPLGAIFGSTWLRDDAGNKVIGGDGFPLMNTQPTRIGNPIPDYVLSFDFSATIKRLRAGFVWEYRHGGDVWNGTRAALDYHGRSVETSQKRQISNYVFDGVTQSGTINTTPVQFYDVTQNVENNRWVRYGFGGVAEDYIEEASFFRLSELNISYSLYAGHRKQEVILSVVGRNLILITPYSGVDPATSLFGYATTQGLDLFNTPSTRSFNFQLTIKF